MNCDMLKIKRMENGFNQEQIAHEIGICVKSYNFKENGKCEFTGKEMVKISEALNLSINDINNIFFDGNLPNGNKHNSKMLIINKEH